MRTSLPSASALLQRNVQPISSFGLVGDDMGQRGKDNIGVPLERRAYLLAHNHSEIFRRHSGDIAARNNAIPIFVSNLPADSLHF
jgi:hypothetical protein